MTDKTAEFIGNVSYDFFKGIRRELRKEIYSVCFSDTWKNENLWLKYADQHKGFAVVYDRSDDSSWLCGTEKECLNCMNKDLNAYIYPMCYSDEKYDATIYARDYAVHKLLVNLNNSYTNPLLQFVPDHPWEKEKITLIKKKCHEYDAEWRAILSTPYYLNTPVYKKWKPYGVIFGLNMEADSCDIYYVFTYEEYDSLLTVREIDREKLLMLQALGKSYGILPGMDSFDGIRLFRYIRTVSLKIW